MKRGNGMTARIIGYFIGFPEAGADVPISVAFSPEGSGERWTRNFGGKIFSSLQTLGRGKNAYLLIERFGMITVSLALVVDENRLFLIPRRWSCFGIPLPKFALPRGKSFESEVGGVFKFDVEISAPMIGLIVAYHGTLKESNGEPTPM